MKYDFDKVIDRRNTNSINDFAEKGCRPICFHCGLRIWVFGSKGSYDALLKVANHAISGYSDVGGGYFSAVHDWF